MMGSEDDEAQQARLFTSTDAMESLILDQTPHPFLSNSDYRSAMSGSSAAPPLEESHPLSSSNNKHDQSQKNFKDSYRKGFEDNNSSSTRKSSASFREADLVEPPSYADAIFTPYMGEASGNGNSREVGDSSSALHSFPVYADTLNITVTQPQKTQETGSSLVPGGSSYVTYLITTRTNIPEYRGTDFTVRRRFRDIVTLADRLAEGYRGYFIPPRPDKSIVESQVMQKSEFIEQRRIALEKYLFRLAAHPLLRRSNELRLFLQFQGKLPLMPTTDIASRMLDGAVNLPRQLFGESSSVLPQEAAQPAKGGRDLVRLFKELRQSMSNDWVGTKPAVVEEDKDFLEKKEKLQELEKQLSDASQQAEVLVKAQQEAGEVMGELGLAFIKIAKFETEEAVCNAQRVHSNDAKRIGTAAVKASRFYRESNAQSVKHLDQLHEYLGLMQALHAAHADRSNALLTVQTLMSDLQTTNSRIDKLNVAASKFFGVDKGRNKKIEELKELAKVNEEARDFAQQEYEHIKDRNRTELERFEKERRRDFLNMIQGIVLTQIGYSEKIANTWTKVVEECSSRQTSAAKKAVSEPSPRGFYEEPS